MAIRATVYRVVTAEARGGLGACRTDDGMVDGSAGVITLDREDGETRGIGARLTGSDDAGLHELDEDASADPAGQPEDRRARLAEDAGDDPVEQHAEDKRDEWLDEP